MVSQVTPCFKVLNHFNLMIGVVLLMMTLASYEQTLIPVVSCDHKSQGAPHFDCLPVLLVASHEQKGHNAPNANGVT